MEYIQSFYLWNMEFYSSEKVSKAKDRHQPEVSRQTGFPSAATHYAEQSIDLHNELVTHQDATYFVRVASNDMEYFLIYKGDVLLIDRSLSPKNGKLALVVKDGAFCVLKIDDKAVKEEYTVWGIITYIIHKAP